MVNRGGTCRDEGIRRGGGGGKAQGSWGAAGEVAKCLGLERARAGTISLTPDLDPRWGPRDSNGACVGFTAWLNVGSKRTRTPGLQRQASIVVSTGGK